MNLLYLKQITVIGATGHTPADIALSLRVAAQDGFINVQGDKGAVRIEKMSLKRE